MGRKAVVGEGDWVLMPDSKSDGVVVTRVARRQGSGGLYLYIFKPVYPHVPTAEQLAALTWNDGAFVLSTGDGFIREGRWKVLPGQEGFDRADWPVVEHERVVELFDGRLNVFRVVLDDNSRGVREERIDPAERGRRPDNGTYGVIAAERMAGWIAGGELPARELIPVRGVEPAPPPPRLEALEVRWRLPERLAPEVLFERIEEWESQLADAVAPVEGAQVEGTMTSPEEVGFFVTAPPGAGLDRVVRAWADSAALTDVTLDLTPADD